MELRQGYKQTEVGVIPEDWVVAPLASVTPPNIKNGIVDGPFGSNLKTIHYRQSGIPIVTSGYVTNGRFQPGKYLYVDQAKFNEEKRSAVRPGDIVMAKIGERCGASAILPATHGIGILSGNALKVTVDPERHSTFYVWQLLSKLYSSSDIELLKTVGAQPAISMANLKKHKIPFPPTKSEEESIAEALSDADDLIESLEQLLAKKRQLKQGAMQELLTGKKRLPGFSGEWTLKRLSDLGSFLKGSGVTKEESLSGNLPCVRYGEIYTRHDDYIKEFYSSISRAVATTAARLKFGDVLFAGSGETKEEIGKCVAFVSRFEAYAGGDIVILRTEKADPLFLGFYLNSASINRQKMSKGQGDAVVHIGAAALADIQGMFPSVTEQTAIAVILSDMDAEIAALEAKLAKARAIKQGMMQELLTGRIRLVRPVADVVQASAAKEAEPRRAKSHNWQINEAVVISVLAQHFGSEQWPLGRKRYTKLLYLLHRHVERQADGYLKKAAGPYNPSTKYKGPEAIALKNGYVRRHTRDKFAGFVSAARIQEAEKYFSDWYGEPVLNWIEQFRYKTNEELELLATVDLAMEDLRRDEKPASLGTVKDVIGSHPEWEAKLSRPIFSDDNIVTAIRACRLLFDSGEFEAVVDGAIG